MEKNQLFFLIKFFAIFFTLQFLILSIPLMPLESFIAKIEAKALNLDFFENKIFVKGGIFSIDSNCTGLLSGAILAAIVFALRKPDFKAKISLFFACFALLFLANFLRIYIVIWFGIEYGINAAELAHLISWFTTSALIILLWYFFTKKIVKVKQFHELV